jgi:photosynthetic reaction center cytochrome c subunit
MDGNLKERFIYIGWMALAVTVALLVWMPAKLSARISVRRAAAGHEADSGAQKTAAAVFKNIQVLKDIPSDQLIPSMRYMTAALGVGCDYCHDADHFDSDDKATKQRARNMMKMMFAINQDNFNGRREVTCYTCHRGVGKAASIPPLPTATISAALPASEPGSSVKTAHASEPEQPLTFSNAATTSLPSVDEILAKYVEAVGGTGAIQKNHTRVEQGGVEGPRGLHATIETYRTAPDEAFAILHAPNGDVTEGVNGQIGWGKRANGEVTDETGDELARSKQWAAFYPGEQFERDYKRFQVRGTEGVNGHDAYLVMAWWSGDGPDRIYFDTQTGLLLRISHRIESPLGALPLETDYEDYREVNGLKIPFTVRVTRVDGTTTYTWQKMDANLAIDASRYEKPAEKPTAEKPEKSEPKPKP